MYRCKKKHTKACLVDRDICRAPIKCQCDSLKTVSGRNFENIGNHVLTLNYLLQIMAKNWFSISVKKQSSLRHWIFIGWTKPCHCWCLAQFLKRETMKEVCLWRMASSWWQGCDLQKQLIIIATHRGKLIEWREEKSSRTKRFNKQCFKRCNFPLALLLQRKHSIPCFAPF